LKRVVDKTMMFSARSGLVVCVVLLSVVKSDAWWCDGHVLTAAIAERNMCPEAKNATDMMVAQLAPEYPKATTFMQAACWPDDLKSDRDNFFDTWHYINLPFIRTPVGMALTAVNTEHNVVWALAQANKTLRANRAAPVDQAMKLFFMIHFAGDVHQPLHAITEYSVAHPPPDGDNGGNLFRILGQNVSELHAFWDSGAGQWQTDINRPMAANDTDYINTWADTITNKVPESSVADRVAETDPNVWANESYMLGVTVGYPPQENTTLPPEFITTAQETAIVQVAVGGYRLAKTLNDIYCPGYSEGTRVETS